MKISHYSFLIFALASLFLISACSSSQKLVSKGKYSDAVAKAIKELQKDPYNLEEQNSLYSSFDFANRDDLDKIKSLRVRGDGQSLIQVFRLYEKLDERAREVSTLPSSVTDELNIYDFGTDMQSAADEACAKVMDEAFLMLEKNNPEESKKALTHLEKVERISPGYPGLKEMLYDAEIAATIAILFKIDDDSRIDMQEDLEEELEDEFRNTKWNKYYLGYTSDPITYVFEIKLNRVSFNDSERSKEQNTDILKLTTIEKSIEAELTVDYDVIDNNTGFAIERKDEDYEYKESHTRYEYEGKLDSLSSTLRKDILDKKNQPFPNSYDVAENNKEEWLKNVVADIKKILRRFD